ncbi:unnamed protein product [Ilex paraguariensis]|uniref:ATP-dependent Clp protease proteolytic subunit n=1 Tax=Ilex paraguariensis TaxID=185542 RepID=A0ABC8S843_9AQUA
MCHRAPALLLILTAGAEINHATDFSIKVEAPELATEMSIRIREMVYHKVKLNKILSRITRKPEQQIEGDTDRDNFMNAWEAKEYGLVDEVIDDGKPGLIAPIAEATAPPKTRVWDLWKVEGSKKAKKNLPSEEKILQNGYTGSQGNDDERGREQKEEEPTPV